VPLPPSRSSSGKASAFDCHSLQPETLLAGVCRSLSLHVLYSSLTTSASSVIEQTKRLVTSVAALLSRHRNQPVIEQTQTLVVSVAALISLTTSDCPIRDRIRRQCSAHHNARICWYGL